VNVTTAASHDVLSCMESARQAGVLLAHRHYGVPADYALVIDHISFRVTAPAALRVGPSPARLLFDMTVSDHGHRRGTLATLKFSAAATVDGRPGAVGSASLLFLPPSTYARLRSQARMHHPGGPLGHVPAMVLMQAAILSAVQVAGGAPQATITSCAVDFERFAELDEPTICRATAGTPAERDDCGVAVPVRARLEQNGQTVASALVEVTL
jgi:hypothetical protein